MTQNERTAESRISPLPFQPAEVRELLSATSETEVAEAVIEIVADRLGGDRCLFVRAGQEEFTIDAQVPLTPPISDELLPIDEDLLSQTYALQRSYFIDDRLAVHNPLEEDTIPGRGGWRSLVLVPLADLGIVVVIDDAPEAFDDDDRRTVEEIVSLGESALDQQASEPELLDEVGDILAHDVQSPLQVALGRVEMAKATGDLSHLDKIVQALRRLEELLDGVVRLVRTGDRIRDRSAVDLEDAVAKVRSALEMPGAELIVEDSAVVKADENCLLEILENLFRNANQHAGPGVTVWVGVLDDGFFVEDDGPGITPERRRTVFTLGTSSGGNRSGIGLGIVKRLVEAHDWQIRIIEGREGGARFEISEVELLSATG